jgi:hypothetical protein
MMEVMSDRRYVIGRVESHAQPRQKKFSKKIKRLPVEAAAKSVSKLKGVLVVKANHISHMLGIEYDPDKATIEEIRRTIENQKG